MMRSHFALEQSLQLMGAFDLRDSPLKSAWSWSTRGDSRCLSSPVENRGVYFVSPAICWKENMNCSFGQNKKPFFSIIAFLLSFRFFKTFRLSICIIYC